MIQGTTPTHTFYVDKDTSLIKSVKITYAQNEKIVLVKRTPDCVINDGKIMVRLSQEDTFLFDPDKFVTILIRVLTIDDKAITSNPVMMSVLECFDDEVLK